MTFTDTYARLTTPSYMKGKVALDHVGLRSGNFGRKGTFFSSQTKGNVVLDQDGLRSGKFGQTETFFTSQTKGLDLKGLRFGDSSQTRPPKRDCFWSNIKVKVVLDHNVLRYFGRTWTFLPTQTRARLFSITLALDPDISAGIGLLYIPHKKQDRHNIDCNNVLAGQGPSSHPTRKETTVTTTAIDPEISAGQGPSSHHTRKARLFLTRLALDPEISARNLTGIQK